MGDLVFLLVILGFFGVCALYVLGCQRLVDREGPPVATTTPEVPPATSEPTGMAGR